LLGDEPRTAVETLDGVFSMDVGEHHIAAVLSVHASEPSGGPELTIGIVALRNLEPGPSECWIVANPLVRD
jgi:hypothetical protein